MRHRRFSIYLAKHGWKVTAARFRTEGARQGPRKSPTPLPAGRFVHADVTHLSRAGIGSDFNLIVDNGCLHNMSDGDRDAYVREVSAMAAHDARLLIVAFLPGGRFGVRGVDSTEMERRFDPGWTVVSAGEERELDREQTPTRYYLYRRRNT